MIGWIASSQQVDLSERNLRIVMIWAGVIIAAAVLAIVPVVLARKRRHRQFEAILAAAIVWGLLAAVGVTHAITAQIDWEKEYKLRVETGYYDPQNKADAPVWPWVSWGILGLGYLVIAGWAVAGSSPKRPGPASTQTPA
jgi:hypothetical protein